MPKRIETVDDDNIAEYNPEGVSLLVKGNIETDRFLRLILQHHNKNKNRLTHAFMVVNPTTGCKFILTDAVIVPHPTADDRVNSVKKIIDYIPFKKDIIVNYLTPNGHYSEKVSESEEARLCEIKTKQRMPNVAVTTYQLDAALDAKVATYKYEKPHDYSNKTIILSASSLAEGNAIVKSFILNGAEVIGFVVGADIPVVLNSRANLKMNERAANFLIDTVLFPQEAKEPLDV